MTKKYKTLWLILVFFIAVTNTAVGATKTWVGANNGTSGTAGNWSPSGAPGGGDDVIINTSVNININGNRTFNSLTITNNANVIFTSSGNNTRKITIDNTGSSIDAGSSLTLKGSSGSGTRSMTIAFSGSNRTFQIAGNLILTDVGEGTIFDATNSNTTVTGSIINDGTNGGTVGIITSTASNLTFSSGGTYEHALNGGNIPTATWDVNSNCLITGVTNTLATDVSQSFGNFTWNNTNQTSSLSYATALTTINGNLTIISTGSGALNLMLSGPSSYTTNVGGNFTQSGGTFRLVGPGSGAGNMTLNVSGNFNLTGGTFDIQGDPTYAGTGVVNLSGNFSMSGSGILTESGIGTANYNFAGTSMQTFTSGGTISNTVNFTVNNNAYLQMADETTTVNGGGTFNLASGGTLGIKSNNGITNSGATGNIRVTGTRTYNNAANYIYNNSAAQVTGNGLTTSRNLTIDNSSSQGVTLSNATTVTNTFTLTSGKVNTTSGTLLSITNTSSTAIVGGSASSFIDGPVSWTLPTNLSSPTSYLYPVGKGTTYLPFTLFNPTTGAGTITACVEGFNSTSGGTADGTTITSIGSTEYWSLTTTGNFTNSKVTLAKSIAIAPMDVVGGSTTKTGTYTLLSGTKNPTSVSISDLIGSNRFFSLAKGKSVIYTPIPSTLNGFSYYEGSGPSTSQSFKITSRYLIDNISVQAPTNYEIATLSGSYSSSLSVQVLNGLIISDSIINVRLKAGFPVGTYNSKKIIASSTDATNQEVTCNGNVLNAPTITISKTTISGINYVYGNGPSARDTIKVSGVNLLASITVTAPSNYEISKTAASGYAASLTFTQSGGIVTLQNVYVRLKSNLQVGTYVGDITFTSTSAIQKNVSCTGFVTTSTVSISTTTLGGFIYNFGSGPSGEQSFTVGGQNLVTNIALTAPSNFEICFTSNGTYVSSLSLTPTNGTVSPTLVYVRLKSGLAIATYGPVNLTIASTGAITQNIICKGQVVAINAQATLTSNGSLFGFVYTLGNGPSLLQSFTISGTSLSANVVVTGSTNFEVSDSQIPNSFGSTVTIAPVSQKVNGKTIYVRMKSGLSINSYGPENISITSTGTSTINIDCNGVVIAVPSITAASTNNGNNCVGSTINLSYTGTNAFNPYWTGPNNYYSNIGNHNLTNNATTPLSGTYAITGSALSNVNILTNGDFEAGNTGFGSSYGYSTDLSTGGAGAGEALYWVGANPNNAHSGFTACADHSPSPGTKQMVINGAIQNMVIIWSQSVSVTPGANYQFSYWVQSVVASSPSQLQLYVNGVQAGPVYEADLATCSWKQFTYNWNAESGVNVAQLSLVNQNIIAGGNDFALDDLVFQQVFPVTSSTNVSVNPNLTPALSVVASANPVVTGTPVTYTATPVNGGNAPSYQWKVNGTNVGTNSPTYSYIPSDGDNVTCVMTSNYSCLTTPTASANVVMIVNPSTNYWMGNISTDWGTATNWTAGYVPLGGENVEYADGTNYVGPQGTIAQRDLHLDVNRSVGQLINRTIRSLLIPPALSLTVNSTITTLDNVDQIYIKASSSQPNGSLIFRNALSAPVYASVEFYSKSSWDKSKPINQKYNWQYFGIPIETVQASPTFDGAYVRERNEAGTDTATHWSALMNNSYMVPFKGYEICYQNPKTTLIQGQLINRNFNSGPLVKSSNPGVLYPGQILFANPYTAAIDVRQITFGSDVEATVYMYNTGTFVQWLTGDSLGNKLGNLAGQYTSVPKNMAGDSGIPVQIPSMSSFLIFVNNASQNAYISFDYNSAVMSNNDQNRVKSNEDKKTVSTIIDVVSKTGGDRMWLFTNKNCTRNFDNGYDARKLSASALSPQIFAVEQDGNYQINSIDDIDNTTIAFQAGQDTDYTMKFTHENTDAIYQKIILYDMVAKTSTDITANGSTYTFSAATTPEPVNRFKIFENKVNANETTTRVNIFNLGNTLNIAYNGAEQANIFLYDLAGRKVAQRKIQPNAIEAFGVQNQKVYIVKLVANNEILTQKILIK